MTPFEFLPNGDESIDPPTGLRKVVSDWIDGGAAKDAIVAKYGNMKWWDVSKVTNMKNIFHAKTPEFQQFNADLSLWSVGRVTTFFATFQDAQSFNSDLSAWDTSQSTSLYNMFLSCWVFNSDLSKWQTSKVKDMTSVFNSAFVFNSDLSGWDVQVILKDSIFIFNRIELTD